MRLHVTENATLGNRAILRIVILETEDVIAPISLLTGNH